MTIPALPRSFACASRGLFALVIAASGLALTGPEAEAGQVYRDLRDTSRRTTSTTGKVLVAIPKDSNEYSHLATATRGYHGSPVRCGLGHDESLDNARFVLMRLRTEDRYLSGFDLCEANRAGRTVLRTIRGSDRHADSAPRAEETRQASPADVMTGGFTIIAAGSTKRSDLPEAMRNDGWALLNANRFRDAADAFAERDQLDAAGQAGHAIALAMTGQLDDAADRLASLGDPAAVSSELSPRLMAQLETLAELMQADRPDAAAVLTAMAGADNPGA
ncbi:MAG: hypothetical protein AAGE65_11555 [Planctomycetota bacterium]